MINIDNINNNSNSSSGNRKQFEQQQQPTFPLRNEPTTIDSESTSPSTTIVSTTTTTTTTPPSTTTPTNINNNNNNNNSSSSTSSKYNVLNLSSPMATATTKKSIAGQNSSNNNADKYQKSNNKQYWCWLLKEYIRLGHAKSMNRVIKIIDQLESYPFSYFNNIYHDDQKSNTINSNRNNVISDKYMNDRYYYTYNNVDLVDIRRLSFPFLYIPNLLRQRSDLFQYFNKNFSFSNILYALSTANIESLLQPNYLPISKSVPIVPFLLTMVYLKLCVSKGEGLRAIVDALVDCRAKIHMIPAYEYPAIPLDVLLNSILLGHVRFIDWDPITSDLIKTEVYFNELFETLYLTGRDYLTLPSTNTNNNNNNNNKSTTLNSTLSLSPSLNNKSTTTTISSSTSTTSSSSPSNSNVISNSNSTTTTSTSTGTGSVKSSTSRSLPLLSIPSEDYNLKTIDIYLNDSRKIVYYNINKDSSTVSQLQEIMIVLESCLRLSLNWISKVTGIQGESLDKDSWWNKQPEQLNLSMKLWIGLMDRIFSEIIKDPNADKLRLIGLIWLGISISLDDESYPLFIHYINKYPDNLSDITKSTLIIKAIGFALIGVQTIEQTIELVGMMSSLWDNPIHQPNTPPTLEHAFLIYKTIHSVFNNKFKQQQTLQQHQQLQLENEIIDWTKVVCDEANNIFYHSNLIQSSKCKFIPSEQRKQMMSQIQEIFYTSVNQSNHLSKHQKIGVATAYSMSKIEPFQDKQACHNILKITLDVLLEEILGINCCLNEWLEKPSDISNLVIKKIESHRTAPIFTVLPSFVTSITTLILKQTYHSQEVSSIQRTLTPTLTGIVRCFSFLFTDIAKSLTPIDSVMGIEIFSQIGFITDDDIPIANLAIMSLVNNVSKSECAITRVVDKLPIYLTVPKDDSIACSKVVIYLHALENLITKVPHSLIINHIVPNLFEYMEYPNEKINKLSHMIMAKIFTIPDLQLTIKMVPKYLSIALRTFPTFTKITSIFTVLVSIIENNSPTNPVVLYSIKMLTDQVLNMMPQDKQKTSLNGSLSNLVHLLFSTLQFIDAQILKLVLVDIKDVIDKAPNFKIKTELCTLLLSEITEVKIDLLIFTFS
ncbi:hypothetical protein PPL_10673 [Heterostelium album PN500]|uniref:Uncharacterized protein n=1 Tax=Heterostelium pallidum (strain ATCC 26659 / Pp 5 / PN500) TaxID=670386 RepID=D3BRR2_HETP5|nr:hypothetical protein PPL_10673 [Heterostelium album PN500]EFA76094.1 hypothetical protein PPL_10673 [Heterostelium album PN500]|eukprot:XP_020428228.1 hypothetical protein PPL_10673 [Heterostelium album PN500]